MRISQGLNEGQVLQRVGKKGADARLTGHCDGAGIVTASIRSRKGLLPGWKSRRVGKGRAGSFAATLDRVPVGGPYILELSCGKEKTVVRNFYVGDVWILAGQSNMQGYGNIANAPATNPLIRCFSMRREWRLAEEPMTVLAESPDTCHNGGAQIMAKAGEILRKNSAKGVGPGLFFARELFKRSAIPQGLISTAHGGTSMKQWTPSREIDGKISFYGSLLDSVKATGQPVAGVLWYQGESDTGKESVLVYTERMKKLVASLRKDLQQPGLPFLMAQIARVFRESKAQDDRYWNEIQEQQRLLPGQIKNLSVVSAIDLPLDDNIHVSSTGHPRLGARLADEADRMVYGNRRIKPTPGLHSVSTPKMLKQKKGDLGLVVDVLFDHITGSLEAPGEPAGFALVDEEGTNLNAIFKTTLKGNRARLFLRSSYVGAKVQYGLGCCPACNITDGAGHALPVFGPHATGKPVAELPFVKIWKVTAPVEDGLTLARMDAPEPGRHKTEEREYDKNDFNLDGFINEKPRWSGHSGHCYFFSEITLPEAMCLDVLMGYDGPFRLWIDGKPFFSDLKGTNPCFADESRKTVSLPAGKHSLRVAMDINHGQAWGFFLRFLRKDVGPGQIASGNYAKPAYSV